MRRAVFIGAALVLLLLCGGCAGAPETEPSAADPVPITAWPENDFTAGLPEPEGSPVWAMDQAEQGSFSLCYEDVSEEAYQDWLGQLQLLGFVPAARASEEVSDSYLLEREGVCLSAAYDPDGGTLVLRIARRSAE